MCVHLARTAAHLPEFLAWTCPFEANPARWASRPKCGPSKELTNNKQARPTTSPGRKLSPDSLLRTAGLGAAGLGMAWPAKSRWMKLDLPGESESEPRGLTQKWD